MKQLLIIGARGWGREVYAMLPKCLGYGEEFKFKGFLDGDPNVLNGFEEYPSIIDSVEHYQPNDNDVFICALGDPFWKRHYAEIILKKGGEFINLIHINASIGKNSQIGYGCIVSRDVCISCDIRIGNFVTFQRLSTIGHDAQIGDYCNLGAMSFMGGGAIVGECTAIFTSSIILPHIQVGSNCTIGAASVVIKRIPNNTTVYGNPAKKLKY